MNNFITHIINEDLKNNTYNKIVVRFPPEPNGYLHLGHVKSIILNSSLANLYNGELNLRFDDTNPEKENEEYVNAIKYDAFWLVDNFTRILWASDYFDTIYSCAVLLIKKGLAYVDDNDIDTIRSMRGDFIHKGKDSVYRTRSIEENLTIFKDMKDGKFKNGEKVLRAKIDMSHSNLNMRDPVLYRIRHENHHNTGDKWCIYPMYDFAHPLSDGIEGISHSICTMEFEDHRPLYDWTVENCRELLLSRPKQIEFSKLEVEGVLLSKRKLLNLVNDNHVSGWSDAKMPTISGLRNRGFTPAILKDFILKCGFSKANSSISKSTLEESVRDVLSPISPRTMAIIDPIEMVIDNFEKFFSKEDLLSIPNHPKDESMGHRNVSLSKSVWVEKNDVKVHAEKDFWRIYPGNWVRLKHGYNVFIKEVIVNDKGIPVKVIADIDEGSKNMKMAKHKAKVALHWLSHIDSVEMNAGFYHDLCDSEGNYLSDSRVEKTILVDKNLSEGHFEFERNGYFYVKDNFAHCLSFLKNR